MKLAAILIGVAVGCLATTGVLAEILVIKSNDRSIRRGTTVEPEQIISLAEGKNVTFAAGQRTFTLKGPYEGPVSTEPVDDDDKVGGKIIDSLARLLRDDGRAGGSYGAVRGTSGESANDPLVVNVLKDGVYCVRPNDEVMLWRPKVGRAVLLNLRRSNQTRRVRVRWPKNQQTVAWPSKLRLVDGGAYLAQLQGQLTARRLVVRFIPADLEIDLQAAAWMADNDCADQAIALLDTLE